jgi:hypothetical protein
MKSFTVLRGKHCGSQADPAVVAAFGAMGDEVPAASYLYGRQCKLAKASLRAELEHLATRCAFNVQRLLWSGAP